MNLHATQGIHESEAAEYGDNLDVVAAEGAFVACDVPNVVGAAAFVVDVKHVQFRPA